MLSFQIKFVQTDRQTAVKQYAPNLSMQGHKNVVKGEDAGYPHFLLFPQYQYFLLFPQCFQKRLFQGHKKSWLHVKE